MVFCRKGSLSLLTALALAWQPTPAQPPTITDFATREGPAGQSIKVEGKGFTNTKRVLFSVGRTFKDAKFKVTSDTEVQVDAPEYYRDSAEAVITVITPAGLTVTVPENALRVSSTVKDKPGAFFVVEPGGVLEAHTGIVFIEPGGVVAGLAQGAVHYARKGGNVAHAYRCVVYHEKGVVFGEKVRKAGVELIEVAAVTRSTVPSLFKYTKPAHAEPKPGAKRTPPLVKDIVPSQAAAGQIVTFRGQGFWGTTGVMFKTGGDHKRAGFRIVSDGELRVEIPETLTGRGEPCPVVVVADTGATLVTDAKRVGIEVVRKGVVHKLGGGDRVVFVESGGVVSSGGGGVTYLVKNGGTVGPVQAGGCLVYHEPKALLGGNVKGNTYVEVPVLHLSSVKAPFQYASKPR